MNALENIAQARHERVCVFQHPLRGYKAIIAIHSTAIGPALGGCRRRAYATLNEALEDVLELSEAMSYKNALCGISFGGGKSVLLSDGSGHEDRGELFEWFGRCVESLGGSYITAEDMGTSVSDMTLISRETRYVAGRDPTLGGGGDPSPYTARGVFFGMEACLVRVFGNGSFRGRTVAVQGVGNVGRHLVRLLAEAGAAVVVSDPLSENLEAVRRIAPVTVVPVDSLYGVECDLFSPCAVGGTITTDSIRELRCRIVAGAANNQVRDREAEEALRERGIIYAPDFAINAGGVILCADEFEEGGFSASRVDARVREIGTTVGEILDEAARTGALPADVARAEARRRIARARARGRSSGDNGSS